MLNVLIESTDLTKAVSEAFKASGRGLATSNKVNGILIQADENAIVFTSTNQSNHSLKIRVPGDVIEKGSIIIDAKTLLDLVKKLPTGTVKIGETNDCKVRLSINQTKITLLGINPEGFPSWTDWDKDIKKFKLTKEQVKQIADISLFAQKPKESAPAEIIKGVNFEANDQVLKVMATDGFRIAYRQFVIPDLPENMNLTVPAVEIKPLLSMIGDEVDMQFDGYSIVFRSQNDNLEFEYLVRLMQGEFISVKNFLKQMDGTYLLLDNSQIKNATARVSIVADEEKDNLIVFDLKDTEILVSSVGENNRGLEKILLDSPLDSETNMRVGFNAHFISEALQIIDTDKVNIGFTGKLSPLYISEPDNDDLLMMVLPVRIPDQI